MPKRLQNQLYVGYPLGTLKITIFDVKTSLRWTPIFPFFLKNRLQILAMTVFGPRCLLEASKSLPRACPEPPKSLPRAVSEPSRSPPQPSKASHEAHKRTPRACSPNFKTLSWKPYLEPLYSKPYLQNPVLKTLSWKPCTHNPIFKTLSWKPYLENLVLKTLVAKPCLENPILKTLYSKP